jgi:Swiss Army Knife RNA repair-like protein
VKARRVIFLDYDGVIRIPPYNLLDKICLENLKRIIKQTGCKLVISSSWRTGNLDKTKLTLPEDLREYIIGETTYDHWHLNEGSTLPIVRGNEIKHWIDRNLVYPWLDNPEMHDLYKQEDTKEGYCRGCRSNKQNIDFTYVILDDDEDFLYEQRNNLLVCDAETGLTAEIAEKAIEILNRVTI